MGTDLMTVSAENFMRGVISEQYPADDPGLNLDRRKDVYDCVPPGDRVDPFNVIWSLLLQHGATFHGTALEVGCNKGSELPRLPRLGYKGLIIGLDPALDPDSPHLADYIARDATGPGIVAIQNVLDETYIPNGSVDVLICRDTLYHMEDPFAAVKRFHRLLAKNGLLALSLKGEENKVNQRADQQKVADDLKVEAPFSFTENFTPRHAEGLGKHFDLLARHVQITDASFTKENLEVYLGSLRTMRPACRPTPALRDYNRTIRKLVRPELLRVIGERGCVSDLIDRRIFIYRKRSI